MKTKELFFGGLLLIITGTFAYYVFMYLPHKEALQQAQTAQANKEKEDANNLAMQQKCHDAGEKAYKQEEEADNVPGLQLVSDPQYFYSKVRNECLYIPLSFYFSVVFMKNKSRVLYTIPNIIF